MIYKREGVLNMNKFLFVLLLMLSAIWAVVVVPISLVVMCTILLFPLGALMFVGGISPMGAVIAAQKAKK